MRTVASTIAVFAVLVAIGCGGKSTPQAPAATAKWPAEATGALTEDELAGFVKVLPSFNAALKAANWQPVPPETDQGPVGNVVSFIEGMNVPGVEDTLKASGGWAKFRPTLSKVVASMTALSIDAAPQEMIEQMKKDTSAAAKKGVENFKAMKAACSQIPEANKQMVSKHQQEMQVLQTLGR